MPSQAYIHSWSRTTQHLHSQMDKDNTTQHLQSHMVKDNTTQHLRSHMVNDNSSLPGSSPIYPLITFSESTYLSFPLSLSLSLSRRWWAGDADCKWGGDDVYDWTFVFLAPCPLCPSTTSVSAPLHQSRACTLCCSTAHKHHSGACWRCVLKCICRWFCDSLLSLVNHAYKLIDLSVTKVLTYPVALESGLHSSAQKLDLPDILEWPFSSLPVPDLGQLEKIFC